MQLSQSGASQQFDCLVNYSNVVLLRVRYQALEGKKGLGMDGNLPIVV
jgi:hypothetical protein